MKNFLFGIATLFFATASVQANTTSSTSYHPNDPIEFVEDGIAFNVFLNGTFNFSTTNYYNNSHHNHCDTNYRPEVYRNRNGQIDRIGNVNIYYDRYDRVSRIGSIDIRFDNRNMIAIGGLQINYNRYGGIQFSGSVCTTNNYQSRPIVIQSRPVIVQRPIVVHHKKIYSKKNNRYSVADNSSSRRR